MPCACRSLLVWLALAGAGVGCGPVGVVERPAEQGEGPGRRHQPLALDARQELRLGRQAYQEILRQSDVLEGGPEVERVRRVGGRIVKASEIEPLQREINLRVRGYRFEWEYAVLRSRHVNAFCLPAGKIGVFTGLLQVTQSDDQLATVMAHEIAHALAHHASERVARERMEAAGLLKLQYNRAQESEADHIGVFLMTFAGYDPRQAVVFWQRMQSRSEGGRMPEILSDHPSDERRIADIREWVPKALAAKQAFDEGRIAPPPDRAE
jgi:predicted Zn-dependent protease